MKEDLDLYEVDQEKVEEILISLLGVVDRPLPSLTHAEKEIFILCKSNPEIQKYFEFEEHYYGAYSQVLEETLDEPLFYEDAFQIEKDGIHLTRQGKKLYTEILDKYKDNEEFKVLLIALKLIREVYDKLSTEELIFLLYFTYPECGKYSNVYESLIEDKQKRKNLTNNLYRKGIITERRYEELLAI